MPKRILPHEETISPPERDIMVVEQYELQCELARKSGPGQPWETVLATHSLRHIVAEFSPIEVGEMGIFVEGFLYWSSNTPELFNATVIEQGKAVICELPHFEIVWTAFLRVTSQQKAQKILARMHETIGHQMMIGGCEPYWKDKSLYRVQFTVALTTADVKEAVFITLHICHSLGSEWSITPPTEYHNQRWEFCGGTRHISGSGITMIDFNLHNFVTRWSKGSNSEYGTRPDV